MVNSRGKMDSDGYSRLVRMVGSWLMVSSNGLAAVWLVLMDNYNS